MRRRVVRVRFTNNGRSYSYRATRRCRKGERVTVYPCGYGVTRQIVGFGRGLYFKKLDPAWPFEEER